MTPGYVPPYALPGHDVTHPQRMCRIAEEIADEDIDLFLLKVAIWFHNLDRSNFPYLGEEPKTPGYASRVIRNFMQKYPDVFREPDIDLVADAVERHNHLNSPDDPALLIYLKDCDRLDGLGAIGIVRAIPYSQDKKLPTYTPNDFRESVGSTREEDLKSMVHVLRRALGWGEMLRIPKAKKMAKPRLEIIRKFIAQLRQELKEIGVV